LNKDRLIEIYIGSCKENVYYRSAPCASFKRCSESEYNYVVTVREKRTHPSYPLNHFNGCPVEIVYLYPQDVSDNCRWVIGLVKHQKEATDNLHNHPIHGPIKIAKCVKESISKAVYLNSVLTPVDISHGKRLEFVPGVVDKANMHLGRVWHEVKKTKLTAANDKNWNCLCLEEQLDKVDLEESQKNWR